MTKSHIVEKRQSYHCLTSSGKMEYQCWNMINTVECHYNTVLYDMIIS